ncbi:hypothetical protein C9E88_001735 [Acinetobacter cumulans]|uniref:Uncharacterized protein n=1 Tax=Acinetobacter cumulans TaxID=2136182 RepID=A0A498DBE0_9GAMM|nr:MULTISPECIES: hypothetical protein [Acinetobacter]QCO20332.1 hypothetical protein C9E88_001735 [Acinetobacter cumulans]RLL35115.1 hypothetical protein D9K80_09765 [Acinetobacter cumulans]RZG59299.1 hypothetical protein EXE29_08270 [Acinetobacter sp. WCHAc060006]
MWSSSLRFTFGVFLTFTVSSASFAMSVLHSFEFPPEKKQQTTTQQPVTTQAEPPHATASSVKK